MDYANHYEFSQRTHFSRYKKPLAQISQIKIYQLCYNLLIKKT